MEVKQLYKDVVLRMLGKFQLLEFALKQYIGLAYKMIQELADDKVPFHFSEKDVENYPLERLANIFAKLNDNSDLSKKINRLRESRNHIAHKALLLVTGRRLDRGEIEDRYIEFTMMEDELTECLGEVIDELKSLSNSRKKA